MKKLLLRLGLGLGCVTSLPAQISHRSVLELDGQSQYLELPSHRALAIGAGRDYSLTFWFRGDYTVTYAATQRIVSHRSTAPEDSLRRAGYEVMVLRNTAKDLVGLELLGRSGGLKDGLSLWASAVGKAELREWQHVAIVLGRSLGKAQIYVNGVLQAERSLAELKDWTPAEGLKTLIGCGTEGGKPHAFFRGLLDNVRFYDRALSGADVETDRCTEVATRSMRGLVAAFDFEDYRAGATEVRDQLGRCTARFVGQSPRLAHPVIKTMVVRPTNNALIGRGDLQALGSLDLGIVGRARLSGLRLGIQGTTSLMDIKSLKVYLSDNADRFDHRSPGLLLLSGKPTAEGRVDLKPSGYEGLLTGRAKLWLVADVAPNAVEGNLICTQIEQIDVATPGGKVVPLVCEDLPTLEHEIVLSRSLVWTPGENGSAHYRIPALVRLNNGTLIAAIDKRKNSEYDLPEDIDVEIKMSHDNGASWSKPITVARGSADYGYGDAAIATDGKTLHMVLVGGSGLWFFPSSASKPLEMYYTQSTDGGYTWSPIRNITKEVYTDRFPNGGFFGSGNGIVTRNGRIAFVAAMRVDAKWGGQMDNVLVYSDDQGRSWQASPVARSNGDEAKVLELADGSLLISSRNRAYKMTPRTFVRSTDGGRTWSEAKVWEDLQGNACNSALARYSLAGRSGGENIILHTLLEANNRSNLKIYMSTDEGKTWPWARTLCKGEAAYSEIAILPDGTIGIISEENDRPGYDIYFTRVSLDWLRRGTNKYSK